MHYPASSRKQDKDRPSQKELENMIAEVDADGCGTQLGFYMKAVRIPGPF